MSRRRRAFLVLLGATLWMLSNEHAARAEGSFELPDGTAQPFIPAYDAWIGRRRWHPHHGRAALEVVGLVGVGTLYYWLDPLRNGSERDHSSFWDRVTLRSLCFDSNLNTTNHLLHPLAGGLVHLTARANGIGLPAAMLYDLAQTLAFEFALELRERPSINDLVFTSVGGIAIGELFFQTANYFSSAPKGGTIQQVAAWSLGFPRRVHMAIDREREPDVKLGSDPLGFTAAYSNGFGIGYEVAALSNDAHRHGLLHRARLDAELIAMPGFMRPGTFATDFGQGNFTELRGRLGFSEDDGGIDEADLQVRATLFGYYTQRVARAEAGQSLNGRALMLGIGPGLRFQSSHWLDRSDQLSTVHLPGAQVEAWLASGALSARLGAESYVDLGAVLSLAYPQFVARHGEEGTKSLLQRRGYAYSFGTWSRLRGAVAWGPLSLSGSVGHGYYRSVQGLDRYQEDVTMDLPGIEEVTEVEAQAALRFGALMLGTGIRERRRASSLAEVEVHRRDRDFHVSFGLVF